MKIRIAQGAAVLLSIGTLATLLMLGVSLARHPFAAPWVEREAEALALRLDRMIATEVDRDWVDARLEAALAEEPRDWSRIDLVQEIARKEKIPPDPALAARVDSARGSDTEMLRRTKRCLRCALDVADCPDPGTLAACNLPLELTPVGDVNALRRNFQAWTTGDPTDHLEVGLAVVGLGATAAAVVTGGGSLTVKAGTSALRVARRTGHLTKSFQAALLGQIRALDFQWEKVPAWLVRGNGIGALVRNHEALSRFRTTVADLGRIHRGTGSYAETIGLLRHIDSPAEAGWLAHLVEAGGQHARAAIEVLGKSRALRATRRLGDAVVSTIKLIVATVVQMGLAALALLNRGLRSAILARAGRDHRSQAREDDMSTGYPNDRSGIGPQYGEDDDFTRRMRLHQSWYRDRVLRVPYGTGPRKSSRTFYGNMLTEESANAGLNFLNPGIFALARQRIAEGPGAEPFRLLRNMLSSQPMCFNLFGALALDLDNAADLVQALWGASASRVTCIRFEWAPEPAAEYLNDRTAFDAFIEYETDGGRMGFIGIETKLSEPFSPKKYDRKEYRRWMTEDAPWRPDAGGQVSRTRHNQLWRDHLLAWAMLRHPDSRYAEGRLTVVYHPGDHHCRNVIGGYRELLHDETTFSAFDLATVVAVWKPLAGKWLSRFEQRYLTLESSEDAEGG